MQVTCVYLFHELPAESRRKAAAEMARVLKPGGILVLTDSVQYGDRPEWDKMLGMFSKFNEPYYMSYISEDLGAVPINICLLQSFDRCFFVEVASSEATAVKCIRWYHATHSGLPISKQQLYSNHLSFRYLQERCLRRWAWSLTTSWCRRPRRPCPSASCECKLGTQALSLCIEACGGFHARMKQQPAQIPQAASSRAVITAADGGAVAMVCVGGACFLAYSQCPCTVAVYGLYPVAPPRFHWTWLWRV